jgi:hypothetical protein
MAVCECSSVACAKKFAKSMRKCGFRVSRKGRKIYHY